MSHSPASGIPGKRKLFTDQNFTSTNPPSAISPSQGGSVVAPKPSAKGGNSRGGSAEPGNRSAPAAVSNNSEFGGSNERGAAAAAAAQARPRTTSPNPNRKHIEGDETDPFAHALNVIRRNTKDSGRPLIKACILFNEFAKKKTGRTNENCDSLLTAILEALADGRKVDGKDTTTHLDSLAEKLQGKYGDAFSNESMERYRAALAEAIVSASRDPNFLAPWGRDTEAPDSTKPFTKEWRKKIEKRAYFSADDLAAKVISGITSSHVGNFFMVTRAVKNIGEVTAAIKSAQARLAAEKPLFNALCNYLLTHDRPEITEANANILLSAMTKPFFRRGTNAETGKMESSFVIPKTAPFMKGADKVTWQKKDPKTGGAVGETKRFGSEGDFFVVLLQDRRHLLDLVFPKEKQERAANPNHAVIGMMAEVLSQDEKKEE